MTLLLPPKVAQTLESHAKQCFPRECCGLLLGTFKDSVFEVVDAWAASNEAPDRDRFEMSPVTLLELNNRARDRELGVLGFYHSHLEGDAFPSAIDRVLAIPGTLHLILAGHARGSPEQRAWIHLESGGVGPVRLCVTPP